MFVLVEFNENYKDVLKELKNYNLTPITIFNLVIKDKNSTKQNLDKVKQLKNKIQPQYSAIKITIERLDNFTQGFINNLKTDFNLIIGQGGLNKINRFFLEDTKIDFLLDPQNSIFKSKLDFIHHFNSGLNQVLCKAGKENDIGLMFSLNFTQGKKYNVAKEIGRINQNLKFARKYKLKTNISFLIQNKNQIKSREELLAITSLFDVSQIQKSESINLFENQIRKTKFKNSINYVAESIEII